MARGRPRCALRGEPGASRQAARRRRAPAGAPPSRPPVRARAPRTGLRQDRSLDRPRGARRRRGGRRLARGHRAGHPACLGRRPGPRRPPRRAQPGGGERRRCGLRPRRRAPRDRRRDPHRRAPGAHRPLDPARVGRLRDRRRTGRDARPRVGRRVGQRRAHRARPVRAAPPTGRRRRVRAPAGRRRGVLQRPAHRARGRRGAAARRLRRRPRRRGRRHTGRPRRDSGRRTARAPRRGAHPRRRRPRGHRLPPPGGAGAVTELLLGIDVGTSACKAAVVDARGVELAHGQAPTPWEPVPTGAELDAETLLGAVVDAARDALERAPEGDVAGIGVTSVAETGMLLDADGAVLRRPVAWHDSRGAAEARALARDLPDFTHRTGLPASALCSLAKLRHLGTEGAARWLNVGEWLVHRLGGRQVSELSLSSRTGLLDLEPVAPYAEALAWAGLPDATLAELVLAGTEAGRSDGAALPGTDGAVLTVAGHDHLVAGVGVGVIAPGDVLDSCGTAEALVRVAPPQDAAARRRSAQAGVTVGWHVAEGRQALLAGVWSGLALREVLEQLGASREQLSAGALAIAPGDAPALELELHSLERPPVRLPAVAPAAVWRGAIDTVTREVQALIAHIDGVAGPRTKVGVTGGWARGPAVLDAKRRFGAIEAPPVVEAGCRGAALLAGVAAGLFSSADHLPAVSAVEKEPA